jgi:putative ABC transport system permease protein
VFRLRALLQRDAVDAEFDAELQHHLDRETQANVARGLGEAEARRVALASFGGIERYKEHLRDERQVRWLEDLAADLKHGVRLVRNNPLFAGAVIFTLALGIGATNTVFTIVNGVLLKTPSYPEPERVISLSQTRKGTDIERTSNTNYVAWAESQRSFQSLALYGPASAVLTGQGEPRTFDGAQVTASFFTTLRARPVLGRAVRVEDEQSGSPRVIVLGHTLWQTVFGGDPNIVGRVLELNGVQRRVVGVMPADLEMPRGAQFWTPMQLGSLPTGGEIYFDAIGRLKDGVTLAQAQADLDAITVRRDEQRPVPLRGGHVIAMSMHDRAFGKVQTPLAFLLGAVVMLLLVACVNVANLTLARSADREREFAVRLAMGANRWRLARQLFVENTMLAVIGGAIGTLVPFALVDNVVKWSPDSVAGVQGIRVDATVLVFSLGITMLAALLFGLIPALTGSRATVAAIAAVGSARSSASRASRLLRSSLVAAEIAAALTLVTGAGLLTKSLARSLAIDVGFRPEQLYSVSLNLPRARYESEAQRVAFYDALEQRVRGLPGIDAVAQGSGLYLYGQDFRASADAAPVTVNFAEVSAEYATTIGLRLVSGRFIDERDVIGSPRVVMVNATLARQLYPGQNVIGRPLRNYESKDSISPTIVGVIADVVMGNIEAPAKPAAFLPSAQTDPTTSTVMIRTSLAAPVVRDAVKRIVQSIDPRQPLSQFRDMREVIDKARAPRRFTSMLINAFASLALVLAIIGLYGVMANAVASRTRELGIRIALGARAENVLQLVMGQGVLLALAGITIGLALAYALARTLSGMLYNVGTHDPFVFATAPLAMVLVVLAACYIPARRATRVDPIVALRQE